MISTSRPSSSKNPSCTARCSGATSAIAIAPTVTFVVRLLESMLHPGWRWSLHCTLPVSTRERFGQTRCDGSDEFLVMPLNLWPTSQCVYECISIYRINFAYVLVRCGSRSVSITRCTNHAEARDLESLQNTRELLSGLLLHRSSKYQGFLGMPGVDEVFGDESDQIR